ncbi:MAG: DUF3857 domain-containing protein [Candidatus Omnitrophica bacterium]|nr:DUF3857 domain-containing protein [Candidatus Omnitrophota bacterium]
MKKQILTILLVIGLAGCSKADLDIWRAGYLSRFSQRSAQAAIDLYQDALTHVPEGARAGVIRIKLGKMYLGSGDYVKAAEQFRRVSSQEANELLARALLKNADYTGALEVFNKIGDKGSDAYLYDYALAAEKSNLYDQALRIYALIQKDVSLKGKAGERISAISLASAKGSFAGIDSELIKKIQASPSQEDYPDASAVYLLIDEDIELTPDNRQIDQVHYVLKVLNDRGKEMFSEVSLGYDSTYEKLELEYARTIKPDGTVVTVGDKNIRDVSVYLNFPLYSNARVRIISMPEIAPGSVIEYKAKLTRTQLPNKKDFDTAYWLQADEPIVLQRCRISVPEGRLLKHKIVNSEYNTFGFDMAPKVRKEGGKDIYSLELADVPQIVPEPGMPPVSRANPYILFSTFDSWQDIYTWWRDLYREKIVPDADIKAKALQLVKDKKTSQDKIRAIYNFCTQEIRYVAVEYGDAGYEPHRASEIFQNKYGDCKDKAILLVSMLNSVGIEAYPVLISTFDSLDVQEDVPTISFNHAIAAVEIDKKIVFMDATGSTVAFGDLPAGDQDRITLVFFKDRYEFLRTPLFGADHNKVSTRMSIKVNEDEGIEGSRQVDSDGIYQQAQRFWLKFTMPTLIEEQLKQRVRSFAPSATLKNYEIKNVDDLNLPVLLSYTFTAPQFLKKAGRTRVLGQLGGLDASGVVKESRRYPIEYSALGAQEETIDVELPAHLAVKYLPGPVRVETEWFDFINSYELIGANTLRFYSLSRTKARLVDLKHYIEYKKAMEEAEALADQQVIIEEKH